MNKETLDRLILGLIANTTSKKLVWKKASGENQFRAILSSSSVSVQVWYDDYFQGHIYSLNVYNMDGEIVDSADYSDVTNDPSALNDIRIKELFDIVHESFYKVKQTFSDLFRDLDV